MRDNTYLTYRMLIWSNILTDTCRRERQAIGKCIDECVTIAANAWLYLMRTTILGSSPLFASESISLLFQLSVCIVYYCFFLFFNLILFFTCQLPVHCLMISGGSRWRYFSATLHLHKFWSRKNPSDTHTKKIHQQCDTTSCKRLHVNVITPKCFLLFSHFPVFMTNVFLFFLFFKSNFVYFQHSTELKLVIHFVEICFFYWHTAICK